MTKLLEAIRERAYAMMPISIYPLTAGMAEWVSQAADDRRYLVRKVEELSQRNDDLSEVVEAVAAWGIGGGMPVKFYEKARELVGDES